jgi:hypothetical protein
MPSQIALLALIAPSPAGIVMVDPSDSAAQAAAQEAIDGGDGGGEGGSDDGRDVNAGDNDEDIEGACSALPVGDRAGPPPAAG